ncbi:MAG TPA: hypothetical protein VEV85_13845 [Bryobacteraceae bacterium]|nr:hypothetical protein [Bryobacteraceae bacterium]
MTPPPLRPNELNYITARNSAIFIAPGAPWGQSVWRETLTRIPPSYAIVEARRVIARFERTLDIPSISISKYTTPANRLFEGLSQEP